MKLNVGVKNVPANNVDDGFLLTVMKKLTTEEFIRKAIAIHGDKYSYHNSVYQKSNISLKIFCNNCGNYFDQMPGKHLFGQGCPKSTCGGTQKLTHEEFILKARKKHGNRYNYLEEYIDAKTPINIQCTICGKEKKRQPNSHLRSKTGGCDYCNSGGQSNLEDFIKKALLSHSEGHYSYEKFVYVDAHTKGDIFCNIHKSYFSCAPKNHLSGFDGERIIRKGKGCVKCGREKTRLASKKSKDEILKKAIHVHGSLYQYDLDSFTGVKDNMNIKCRKHGWFSQTPDCHINSKQGCPICKLSHGEEELRKILNNAMVNYISQYTIDECRNKRPLPFDFAILNETNGLKGLIEFHGRQHYEHVDYLHKTYQGFIDSQRNDSIKSDFCSLNRIPFLVIPHYEIDGMSDTVTKFLRRIKGKNAIIKFYDLDQMNIFQFKT